MPSFATVLVGLDVLSAFLEVGVAIYFFTLWNATRQPLHLLVALGLALVGVSFSFVSASALELGRTPGVFDHLRFSGQTGGALVILFAYASARARGRVRPLLALGFAAAIVSVAYAVLYFVIPPAFTFPDGRTDFIVSHSIMTVAWAATAVLAVGGGRPILSRTRLLVPGAFLCFAVGKYSALMVDVTADGGLIPFVLPWRFLGIALLITAIVLPTRGERPTDAA